jgi:hypothetical protein
VRYWEHWDFSFTESFRPHWGSKDGTDNLTGFMCRFSRNSGSLLKPISACPGLYRGALPFTALTDWILMKIELFTARYEFEVDLSGNSS